MNCIIPIYPYGGFLSRKTAFWIFFASRLLVPPVTCNSNIKTNHVQNFVFTCPNEELTPIQAFRFKKWHLNNYIGNVMSKNINKCVSRKREWMSELEESTHSQAYIGQSSDGSTCLKDTCDSAQGNKLQKEKDKINLCLNLITNSKSTERSTCERKSILPEDVLKKVTDAVKLNQCCTTVACKGESIPNANNMEDNSLLTSSFGSGVAPSTGEFSRELGTCHAVSLLKLKKDLVWINKLPTPDDGCCCTLCQEECSGTEKVKKGQKKKKRKMAEARKVPNHFIAIQLKDPQLANALASVQDGIVKNKPAMRRVMTSPLRFHITLMVFRTENEDDIVRAEEALRLAHSRLKEAHESEPLKLVFEGLGNFRNQVVFADVPNEGSISRLKHLSDIVRECFDGASLGTTDKRFTVHVTLMKMSQVTQRWKRDMGIKLIDPSLYSEFEKDVFGEQIVDSLQLCAMSGTNKETGYYRVLHEVPFNV